MNQTNDSKLYKLNPTTGSNTLVTSGDKSRLLDSSKLDEIKEGLSEEQHDELDDDVFVGGYLTCCGSLRFFVKNACTDIGRHKCQFCLAFCSVFIVVLSVIVVNSVIAKGPLIFLQLAESTEGAFDAVFAVGSGSYQDNGDTPFSYNYTQITELYGDKYNLSPRRQFNEVTANYSHKVNGT